MYCQFVRKVPELRWCLLAQLFWILTSCPVWSPVHPTISSAPLMSPCPVAIAFGQLPGLPGVHSAFSSPRSSQPRVSSFSDRVTRSGDPNLAGPCQGQCRRVSVMRPRSHRPRLRRLVFRAGGLLPPNRGCACPGSPGGKKIWPHRSLEATVGGKFI